MGSRHQKFNMMKVCIVSVLIFALYIGAEAQQGGSGSNGRGRGGGRGGRVGKPWKKPRKGLDELCGTELNLECEDGKWPRLFKGSACEDIFTEVSEDTVLFPTYQELENPCTGANSEATSTSCYVCGAKTKKSDKSNWWKQRWTVSAADAENGIDLEFTFPCKVITDLKNLTCTKPE